MEFPQPSRPFAAEGRKAARDFISLCGHSSVQQDQQSSSHGGYLKTHNFLQPLEKEDNTDEINIETRSPSAPPSIEQVSPGGTTYSISHVSYFSPRMPKSEGNAFNMASAVKNNDRKDENSNCSSFTAASSFTVWDESSLRKGKTGKEHPCDLNVAKGELQIRVDGRASNDQKPNTPRSKHSATEQRRRCKINDRFLMLRELIPPTDQKRDKASFLLEVIQYIRFLQEKVSRYEGYPGGSSEPTKLTSWRSSPKLAESFADQPGSVIGSVLVFKPDDENHIITSNLQRKQQNPAEPVINYPISLKTMDQQTGLTNKATSIPIPQLKADICPSLRNNSERNNSEVIQNSSNLAASDTENASLQQLQLCQSRPCSSGFNSMTSNQELAVEDSTMGISSMYSQGLLNSLTQALKSSGVDVSQASISVQVDVGKQTNPAQSAKRVNKVRGRALHDTLRVLGGSTKSQRSRVVGSKGVRNLLIIDLLIKEISFSCHQDFDINFDIHTLVHERVGTSRREEFDHTAKKLKTVKR